MLNILFFALCLFTFNIVSINTQGLRSINRRQTVFNLIKKQKYDIIFLQETYWTNDLKDVILKEWRGDISFNNFESNARGTAILFHPNFDFRVCQNSRDPHGRTIQTKIEHVGRKFNLVNVYAPCTDKERRVYFHAISAFLSSTEENILGGDFNCISNAKLDKLGGKPLCATNGKYDLIYDYATK